MQKRDTSILPFGSEVVVCNLCVGLWGTEASSRTILGLPSPAHLYPVLWKGPYITASSRCRRVELVIQGSRNGQEPASVSKGAGVGAEGQFWGLLPPLQFAGLGLGAGGSTTPHPPPSWGVLSVNKWEQECQAKVHDLSHSPVVLMHCS